MKTNKHLVLGFMPFLSVTFLLGCNNGNSYSIKSFKEMSPDVYVYTTAGFFPSITKNEATSGKLPVYLINDNSIPYLSIATGVENYLNYFALQTGSIYSKYTYESKDNKTVITNGANQCKCTIDYNNQTMEFDDYCGFLNNDSEQVTPMDRGFTEGRQYFKNIKKEKYVAPKTSYIIDFKKYDIPLFYKDNEGYIPNEVYSNILCAMPPFNMTYVNNNLYFTSEVDISSYSNTNRVILNKAINANFSSDYMKYCYNLNALTLDNNFGINKRESRGVTGYTINYTHDAYTNMNKYGKDNFLSNEPNLANQALINTIMLEYDDGGHSLFNCNGFLENKRPTIEFGTEYEAFSNTHSALSAKRTEAHLDPQTGAIGSFEISSYNGNTAFLTMDKFVEPNASTIDNSDTIKLVRNANNQLRKEAGKKVENLVIDLSLNLGGSAYTECFMSSWLTKGKTHFKMCSYLTGSYSDVSYQADVNGDGEITDDDYIPDTIKNIYVITSPVTFSCGNLLACDLRDYTDASFIGYQTGGGCCTIHPRLQSGYGSPYQLSSIFTMCRVDADENNFIDNDSGVKPVDGRGKDLTITLSAPAVYYNRDLIVQYINVK